MEIKNAATVHRIWSSLDSACCCSVPVYACTRCGASDYGDNAEANERRAACAAYGQENWL